MNAWTSDAIETVKAMVYDIAGALIPGWSIKFKFAESINEIGGLAFCVAEPRREQATIAIAPHPPDEKLAETIAHEIGHAWISPLVELIAPSEAATTIEEVLIERFSKFATARPTLRRAIAGVLANPRTSSPIVRKRISALASRRRNEGKNKMADGSRLAELAMKAGEMGAREDVPEDVRALLAEFVAELAGGGAPASNAAPPMREDGNADPANPDDKAMREGDVPAPMQKMYRMVKQSGAMMLQDTIRLRLHTEKTIGGLALDPATEKDLAACATLDQFEREFRLVKRIATGGGEQRKRSGVNAPDGTNGAPSIESLIQDGIPEAVASHVIASYGRGAAHGAAALETARKYRKAATNG